LYIVVVSASAAIHLNWHYKEKSFPHISDSGSADVDVVGTEINLDLIFGVANARPKVTVNSISVKIGNVNIHLHGGASWLYDLFIGLLKGVIIGAAEKALDTALSNAIDTNLNRVLQEIPVEQNISNVAAVEFGLSSAPVFGANYVSIAEQGEFLLLPHKEPPFFAPAIPDIATSEMIQIIISSYVLDSASWVFWTAGMMKGVIPPNIVPPDSPIQLNTSSWKTIVPELYNKFPNMPLVLTLVADSPPNATFLPTGITVSGTGEMQISVLLANGSTIPAFVLSVNVTTKGEVYLSGLKIFGNLTYLSDSVDLKKSYIGPFDPTNVDNLVKFAIGAVVLPYLNHYLAMGVEIPLIKGIEFIAPTVGYGNSYIFVSTNIKYGASSSYGTRIRVQ